MFSMDHFENDKVKRSSLNCQTHNILLNKRLAQVETCRHLLLVLLIVDFPNELTKRLLLFSQHLCLKVALQGKD